MNPLKALDGLGQSVWLDYIRRTLIGPELDGLVKDDGVNYSPKWLVGVSRQRGFVLVGAGATVLKILVPDGLRMHFIRAAVGAAVR